MTNQTKQTNIDNPSFIGQFGWEKIGSDVFAIPVILRSNGIRYSPVRIVEQEIIKKYDALPQGVFQCITLKSFYLTPIEAKLLNNVNFNHCCNRYGSDFFSSRDVIISAADVKELSRFLNISHEVFTGDIANVSQNFGILRFLIDPDDSNLTVLIPYITKDKPRRFVPSKMVEAYVVKSDNSVRGVPNDWDIMYLKMLSIYCENNSQKYVTRDSQIILLEGLFYSKTNSPVVFEDFKPLS